MNKILLTTLFSGYNYGSSLQTFATKSIIEELGCECELVARKSIVKGRDIRLGKLFTILWRTLLTVDTKTLKAYKSSYQKTLIGDSVKRFTEFEEKYLQPKRMGWSELKKEAKDSVACVAGSDQLWDPTTLYVDPMYYLRFAPSDKRISFATSMGHDFVAKYNEKRLRKWISEVKYLSVREDSGVKLIKELCGRDALHLLDPTLLLNGETWRKKLEIQKQKNKYILAYFVVEDELLGKCAEKAAAVLGYRLIELHYKKTPKLKSENMIFDAGPREFLMYIRDAEMIFTNSFHGTVFSILFQKKFYSVYKENGRISNLLAFLNLEERHITAEDAMNYADGIDYTHVGDKLCNYRRQSVEYLKKGIEQ